MAKEKKKLKKAIESIEEQIRIHEKKIEEHGHEQPWLGEYWKKQIKIFEEAKRDKEKRLSNV